MLHRASGWHLALLAALTVACLAPWLTKPFVIDDPLFLWSAERILRNPADFYGGYANWFGRISPLVYLINNPPLQSYLLAGVARLTGLRELPLHAMVLVQSVLAVLGTYCLARRFTAWPMLAALATLTFPGFLLSSTNVMCDTLLLACWVWSLLFWVKGLDEQHWPSLAAAAILMSCCGLAKYFGIAILPLALAYGLLARRRPGWWCFWLLLPLSALIGLEAYAHWYYDRGLISDAGSFALNYVGGDTGSKLNSAILATIYLGAMLVTLLAFLPWLWTWRGQLFWMAAAILIAAWLVWDQGGSHLPMRGESGIDWMLLTQTTLFILIGLQALWLSVADVIARRSAHAILLLCWLIGTFAFAAWFNWAINVRSLLPAIPVVSILLARRLERRGWDRFTFRQAALRAAVPLATGLVLAEALCWADFCSAKADRTAAELLLAKYPVTDYSLSFQGHWGWQYYLEKAGARSTNFTFDTLNAGDVVLLPEDSTGIFLQAPSWLESHVLELPLVPWLTTNSNHLRTSFYSSSQGLLPYRFVKVRPRKYAAYVNLQQFNYPEYIQRLGYGDMHEVLQPSPPTASPSN